MRYIIIFLLTTTCFAGKVIMTDPVTMDTSFSAVQVDQYLNYYAFKALKDSGVIVSKGVKNQEIVNGGYGSRAEKIFQTTRMAAFESLFSLLYVSFHFKSIEDCEGRWQALQWFHSTGKKLCLPEDSLKEAEDETLKLILGLCDDLSRGLPLGAPVVPSP